ACAQCESFFQGRIPHCCILLKIRVILSLRSAPPRNMRSHRRFRGNTVSKSRRISSNQEYSITALAFCVSAQAEGRPAGPVDITLRLLPRFRAGPGPVPDRSESGLQCLLWAERVNRALTPQLVNDAFSFSSVFGNFL